MRTIRYIFLFTTACLLMAGCTGNSGIEEKDSKKGTAVVAATDTLHLKDSIPGNGIRVIFTPISYEEYLKDSAKYWKEIPAEDGSFLRADAEFVTLHDSTYTLLLNNGSTVKIKSHDNTESDDYIKYIYMGMTKQRDFYIFSVGLYESMRYTLVSAETGKEYDLWNYPLVSPGGKWILSYSYDMEAGFLPNGFQVLKNDKNELRGIDYNAERWGVIDGFWMSNNTADIVQNVPIFGDKEMRYDYHYARVEVKEENGK